MHKRGETVREIAFRMKCSTTTVQKIITGELGTVTSEKKERNKIRVNELLDIVMSRYDSLSDDIAKSNILGKLITAYSDITCEMIKKRG